MKNNNNTNEEEFSDCEKILREMIEDVQKKLNPNLDNSEELNNTLTKKIN